MNNNEFMKLAIETSKLNSENSFADGGPFGAVIVKDNEVIAASSNSVIGSKDPTAHAEVNAIRLACQKLTTHDLTGCVLYASCYPCPMCLSAIIWSNIKEVYYANTKDDANDIGFRDKDIYELLKNPDLKSDKINFTQLGRDEAIKVFDEYKKSSNARY